LTLPDIKSETMLHALSAKGICISHGSACSSRAQKVSSALTAFGLSADDAASSVRISFGVQNTREQIDRFADVLSEELNRLVRIHR
jgi:cysteine desulfurase